MMLQRLNVAVLRQCLNQEPLPIQIYCCMVPAALLGVNNLRQWDLVITCLIASKLLGEIPGLL